MPARRRKSKRPPRTWIADCIAGVKRAGKRAGRFVRDPGGVCGALWYHEMTPDQKRRAKRRHPN